MSLIVSLTAVASESPEPVNEAISWGIGGGILVFLLLLMAALVAFGGGREHS